MKKVILISAILFFASLNQKSYSSGLNDYLVIDANINGQPVHLALDTGAEVVILFQKTVDKLNLPVTQPPQSVNIPPGKISTGISGECFVSFGGEKTVTRFAVYKLPPEAAHSPFDGVIGWKNIRKNILCLDADTKKIKNIKKLPEDINSWSKWNIHHDQKFSVLLIKVPDASGNDEIVLIDTADPGGVSLNAQRWKTFCDKQQNQPFTLEATYSPATGINVDQVRWADSLTVGNFLISNVPVSSANPVWEQVLQNYQGSLGLFALTKFDVIIDDVNSHFYARPKKEPKSKYTYNRAAAVFVPKESNNNSLVAHVVENGPAYKAGVRDGDIILKINDIDVTRWKTDPNVRPNRFFEQPAGTKLELSLMRDDKPFKSTVELKEIFPQPSDKQ